MERLGGGLGRLSEGEGAPPHEALCRGDGDLFLTRRVTGAFCDGLLEHVAVAVPGILLVVWALEPLGTFPEEGLLTGEVKRPRPPIEVRSGFEVEFLPIFASFTSLSVLEDGGAGGGGAREALLLLRTLVVAVVVFSVEVSETSFKVSSSSCRSFSLFFTITLRLMVPLLPWASGTI